LSSDNTDDDFEPADDPLWLADFDLGELEDAWEG
jgi:hypothetical protein